MKASFKILPLIALAAAFSACNKAEHPDAVSDKQISLWSGEAQTRADGAVDRNLQPLFLFWTAGNFNNASAVAPDFFVKVPEGEINDYSVTRFNTYEYYPLNNKVVFAAGVAPAPGPGYLEFVNSGDYTQFKLGVPDTGYPDDAYGVTDVMTAAMLSGSNDDPFTPNDPLRFRHITTKIGFSANVTPTMTKYVKFVTVKFPGSLAPKSIAWNASETDPTYVLAAGTDGTDDFVMGNFWTENGTSLSNNPRANSTMFYQLSSDKYTSMGYTHIVPPGGSIDVIVAFKVADTVDGFDTGVGVKDVEVPVTINFTDDHGDPIDLVAGDAYLIQMGIDVYDIELVGRKCDWEDGGFVSIPIQIR